MKNGREHHNSLRMKQAPSAWLHSQWRRKSLLCTTARIGLSTTKEPGKICSHSAEVPSGLRWLSSLKLNEGFRLLERDEHSDELRGREICKILR